MTSESHERHAEDIERVRINDGPSLSRRLTWPRRAAGRLVRRTTHASAPSPALAVPTALGDGAIDRWLEHSFGTELTEIDRACAESGVADAYALFRDLDDDLWALLLTQQYDLYPNIKAVLPDVPEPALQELWNGRSGLHLARQSCAFYTKLRLSYQCYAVQPLSAARVLDFGCGWGRLTRYLARDVAPGNLYGCDPLEGILETCRQTRVPATFASSSFLPEQIPFEERFDLVYAFSVFTHLSERAAECCVRAVHRSMTAQGLVVLTVRPPAYAQICQPLGRLAERKALVTSADPLGTAGYLFASHLDQPGKDAMWWGEHDIDYGETIITLGYVRERWADLFELVAVGLLLDDPYQVVLTLRRR